jgi:hypothetical protein
MRAEANDIFDSRTPTGSHWIRLMTNVIGWCCHQMHACRKVAWPGRNFSWPNWKIILEVASKNLYKKLGMIITMIKLYKLKKHITVAWIVNSDYCWRSELYNSSQLSVKLNWLKYWNWIIKYQLWNMNASMLRFNSSAQIFSPVWYFLNYHPHKSQIMWCKITKIVKCSSVEF